MSIKATVDDSSLETSRLATTDHAVLDVDIVFKLDIKRFLGANGQISHQILLTAADVNPILTNAGIHVRHLVDLGILKYSTDDPDFDAEVICRVEFGDDLWTNTAGLREVWDALVAEVESYEPMYLVPPHVNRRRSLRIGIVGMKYFNGFTSPDIQQVSRVYLSHEVSSAKHGPKDKPKPLILFH